MAKTKAKKELKHHSVMGVARNDFGPANLPWEGGGRHPELKKQNKKHGTKS